MISPEVLTDTACCGTTRFGTEAALVVAFRPQIVSALDLRELDDCEWVVLTEFESPRRRPDLLAVAYDHAERARRTALGVAPLGNRPAAAQVLAALTTHLDGRRVFESCELEALHQAAGFSVSYLRGILAELVTGGWLARASKKSWELVCPWVPPARRLVSVEAKLSRTREAVVQVHSHQLWADEAWLLYDAGRGGLDPHEHAIAAVGICASCHETRVLQQPIAYPRLFPRLSVIAHEAAGDRIVAGELDGEDRLVFGARLGVDGVSERVVGRAKPDGYHRRRNRPPSPYLVTAKGVVLAMQDPLTGRWIPDPQEREREHIG